MTKKLEDLLNLPDSKELVDNAKDEEKKAKKQTAIVEQEETFDAMQEFDKITAALPQVKGLGDKADAELEDIANRALDAYEDLMSLGMNVESRYSGRVFEVAGSMLKTGLDAKTAKLDKKLKMIELQLKKEKMDKDAGAGDDGMINGEGYVVTDRNSLLERLKGLDKDK
jgi:copper chaperone CopZ